MGKSKKGANKIAGDGVVAAAPTSTPIPAVPEPTEEELEAERRKQELREKKAREQEQKAADERWWREERQRRDAKEQRQAQNAQKQQENEFKAVVRLAKEKGVLEAEPWDDGYWYVDLGKKTYKQVDDEYYCTHCSITLSWCALESHIKGERHRKNSGQSKEQASSCSSSTTASSDTSSSSANLTQASLEGWQKLTEHGEIKCTLCDKLCDGLHETTKPHLSKLAAYQTEMANVGYPPPPQPWLAWAPCEWDPSKRNVICLFCKGTAVDDFEGKLTASYSGLHGALSNENQKGHRKKMADLDYWMQDKPTWDYMMAQRQAYHPELASTSTPHEDDVGEC